MIVFSRLACGESSTFAIAELVVVVVRKEVETRLIRRDSREQALDQTSVSGWRMSRYTYSQRLDAKSLSRQFNRINPLVRGLCRVR